MENLLMLDDWQKLQLSLVINSAVYTCEDYKKRRENAIKELARFACAYLVDYAETDEKKMHSIFTRVSLFEFGNKKFKIALRMCWLIFIESKGGKSLVCQLLSSLLDATDSKAKEIERDESAEAYCLRALCLHELKPESEGVIKDIRLALNMWLSSDQILGNSSDEEKSEFLPPLLYDTLDLLLIKGAVHEAAELIKVIIKNVVDPSKMLCVLWECRRLSHGLCFCPISEVILEAVSESCGDRVKQMNWWIKSLENYDDEVFLGFANCFSSFVTFPEELPRCAYSWRISVDVVLDQMRILHAKDYPSDRSIFLAGYLFFDFSERLIFAGRLHEALVFSKQAYGLRSRLFQKKFTYGIVKVTRKSWFSFGLKSLQTSRISNDSISFEDFYLGPWGVLQAYLESILQVGKVYEMLGNASRADMLLSWGWNISNFEGLSHYSAAFSTILVRFFRKKQEHDEAFTLVGDLVTLKSGEVTCKICTLFMEVSSDLERGELCRMKGELEEGESICKAALAKLDGCETLHKRRLIMTRSRTHLKNCACAPIADVINGSLHDYIKLMWEFKHKRICAKLLMCIAKCYRENIVHGDIHDIFRYCMANLSCPARYKNCDASFSSLIKCIGVDVPGDTFAIERAELLFIVCWVSLRRYPWSLCDSVRDIISQSISWLELAFMLCREFPLLHQKVSRLLLLANFYSSSRQFPSSEIIIRSQRVAFYLQASIGTHMNYLLDLNDIENHADTEMLRPTEFNLLPSTILGTKMYDFGRHLVAAGLDDRVISLFSHLPRATIICLVFIKGIDASLVKHIFGGSHTGAWIVMCRIVSCEEPIVTLFPVHQIMKDDSDNQTENVSNNMIYDLVPSLQVILNEREQSSHTWSEQNKKLWHDERKKLDIRLKELLRKTEQVWFGSRRFLFDGSSQEPIILVMDWEVQVFPWESLPILREQDVYRMYSVNSIMKRCREGMLGNSFPSIDPYELYYLLNPDGEEAIRGVEGDLTGLFEKGKGLVGRAPSHQDLQVALDESELFFFLGHGSTLDRLICRRNIKTSKCSAALLMACGSASIALNGAYVPRGPCLSLMVTGAPFAFGNLWGVSCGEAVVIGKHLLKSMIMERIEHHGTTIGLMMRQARNNCTWPYTTGAGVVCYGVPTSLVAKEK